jgi:hypothetical protein
VLARNQRVAEENLAVQVSADVDWPLAELKFVDGSAILFKYETHPAILPSKPYYTSSAAVCQYLNSSDSGISREARFSRNCSTITDLPAISR